MPVQIAPVGEITRAAFESQQVDDRHANDGSLELKWIEFVEHASNHFDAVQLVAMHGCGQAQHRPAVVAVHDEHRRGHGNACKGLSGLPREASGCARQHVGSQHVECR